MVSTSIQESAGGGACDRKGAYGGSAAITELSKREGGIDFELLHVESLLFGQFGDMLPLPDELSCVEHELLEEEDANRADKEVGGNGGEGRMTGGSGGGIGD